MWVLLGGYKGVTSFNNSSVAVDPKKQKKQTCILGRSQTPVWSSSSLCEELPHIVKQKRTNPHWSHDWENYRSWGASPSMVLLLSLTVKNNNKKSPWFPPLPNTFTFLFPSLHKNWWIQVKSRVLNMKQCHLHLLFSICFFYKVHLWWKLPKREDSATGKIKIGVFPPFVFQKSLL